MYRNWIKQVHWVSILCIVYKNADEIVRRSFFNNPDTSLGNIYFHTANQIYNPWININIYDLTPITITYEDKPRKYAKYEIQALQLLNVWWHISATS